MTDITLVARYDPATHLVHVFAAGDGEITIADLLANPSVIAALDQRQAHMRDRVSA